MDRTVGAGEIVDFFGRRSFDSILRITKHRKLMETRRKGHARDGE